MPALITGAAGMIGRRLALRLGAPDALLLDVVEATSVPGVPIVARLEDPGVAERLIASRPDPIFHLAAVVSGEAEADFAKGYRVNLDGTRALFEAIRAAEYRPRVVFTSSIAAYGGPFPEVIPDDFPTTPQTSYGVQKVICEQLLVDYVRKGFLDGIGLRLPNICIRPGTANLAASGFFSAILREPLAGREAILPVGDEVRMWHASPRSAVGFLLHAAAIDLALLGGRRSLMMPGVSATVGEQVAALREAAGEAAVGLIRRVPDARIMAMMGSIPGRFATERAAELGFVAETDFAQIIAAYREDEGV